jgi:hypothetical protein
VKIRGDEKRVNEWKNRIVVMGSPALWGMGATLRKTGNPFYLPPKIWVRRLLDIGNYNNDYYKFELIFIWLEQSLLVKCVFIMVVVKSDVCSRVGHWSGLVEFDYEKVNFLRFVPAPFLTFHDWFFTIVDTQSAPDRIFSYVGSYVDFESGCGSVFSPSTYKTLWR